MPAEQIKQLSISQEESMVIRAPAQRLRHLVLVSLLQSIDQETTFITVPGPRDGYWGIDIESVLDHLPDAQGAGSVSIHPVSVTDAVRPGFWEDIGTGNDLVIDTLSEAVRFAERCGTELDPFLERLTDHCRKSRVVFTDNRYPPRKLCNMVDKFYSIQDIEDVERLVGGRRRLVQQRLSAYEKLIQA